MSARYEVAGEDASILLPFIISGVNGNDYVVPDPNSVEWNVRGHDGTLMTSWQSAVIGSNDTQTTITVSAALNTKTRSFERRSVEYRWLMNGGRVSRSIPYVLTDRVVFDATPDQVRECLGVNRSELPDHEIDLISSYHLLAAALGGTVLRDKLDLGTIDMIKANRAIVLHTALEVLPALRLKAAQSEKSGAEGFTRYTIDWDKLEHVIRRELLSINLTDPMVVGSTMFVLSEHRDIFYA